MAFKDLCFGIIVLSIATSVIEEVQGQELQGKNSGQPGTIQNSNESYKRKAISLGRLELNGSSNHLFFNSREGMSTLKDDDNVQKAHAAYVTMKQYFTGFIASLTVYNPTVKHGQMSKSYISIQSTLNQSSELVAEEIQAGWMVDPLRYGDSRTHFFTSLRDDNCINFDCQFGFVLHEDAYLAPGDVLDEDDHLTIKFLKDDSTGNWGLFVGPGPAYLSQIGYFPASLFTGLSFQATSAEFGGGVKFINALTSPPMGNGVFAKDIIPPGQPTPAMMIDINFVNPDGSLASIDLYYYRLGYLNCYGLGKFMIDDDRFVYGGHGGCYS